MALQFHISQSLLCLHTLKSSSVGGRSITVTGQTSSEVGEKEHTSTASRWHRVIIQCIDTLRVYSKTLLARRLAQHPCTSPSPFTWWRWYILRWRPQPPPDATVLDLSAQLAAANTLAMVAQLLLLLGRILDQIAFLVTAQSAIAGAIVCELRVLLGQAIRFEATKDPLPDFILRECRGCGCRSGWGGGRRPLH